MHFRIIRKLTPYKAKQLRKVKTLSGYLAPSILDTKLRWQEHFQELFSGVITSDLNDFMPRPSSVDIINQHGFRPTWHDVLRALQSCANGRSLGLEGISSEIWKLGGSGAVTAIHNLILHIIDAEYAPQKWRGGRIVDLWKGEGDPAQCDLSRGLLISDHISKVFTELLLQNVLPAYNSYLPEEQCGCVSHRGTDFGNHLVRTFLDYCRIRKLSCMVLFIDLTKAFDLIIREILMGWQQGFCADPVDFLSNAV